MANPAKLTVTALEANDSVARPAADTIDTNGTVPILAADMNGATDRLIIEVTNGATRALTVDILAGDNPPALRQALGDLSQGLAENAVRLFGPFEGARFMQDNARINVTFTGTGGAAACSVRTYLLPKAV